MAAILLAFVASVGFFASSLLVHTGVGMSARVHHFSVVIAAGILLGVTFGDLIPESLEIAGKTDGALAIVCGFFLLYAFETLTQGHTHHHEPHPTDAHGHHDASSAHAHSHGPALDADGCIPKHAVLPFLIGLSLHNLSDGIVIGASDQVSNSAAAGVAVGILIHQLPVGLSFGAVLLASGLTRRRARLNAVIVAGMILLGTLVVVSIPKLAGATLGELIGVAAGALVYVATSHLLPEAQSEERRPGLAAAFAVTLIGTVIFIGATEPSSPETTETSASAATVAH